MSSTLTLGELVGPVDVVATDDNDGKLKALLVGLNQHLGGSLAGSVRVGGGENARLKKVIVIIVDLTVDLVSGDVDEALDVDALGTLQQHVGTVDVGVCESVRVTEAQIDVGLSGEVEDGVDLVPLQALDDFGGVGNVAVDESEVGLFVQYTGVVERRAVVQLVEGDDVVVIRVSESEMADEPASAEGFVSAAGRDTDKAQCQDRNLHEACTTGNHDVLDIGQRLELGASLEKGSILPYTDILKKLAVAVAVG